MNATKQLDWQAKEEQAKGMSTLQLHYAIVDIRATLENADALDRVNGTNNGGYYRDESSVYWRELRRR